MLEAERIQLDERQRDHEARYAAFRKAVTSASALKKGFEPDEQPPMHPGPDLSAPGRLEPPTHPGTRGVPREVAIELLQNLMLQCMIRPA
jgi:hypothetical protein